MNHKANKGEIGPGYQFGDLTVVAPTDKRKNGYMIWKCRCSCGNEIEMDTRWIQRETQTSCGCKSPMQSRTIDLTGQKFGRLRVIEAMDSKKNGSTLWTCRCDCGQIVCVSSRNLRKGAVSSCGCAHHTKPRDLMGQRFGSLVVIGYEGKKNGQHYWKCQCDCGNEAVVGQTSLLSKKTRSCGCRRGIVLRDHLRIVEGTSLTILERNRNHLSAKNTSGYTGVYKHQKTGKWVAQITFKGKTRYLGSYSKIEEAIAARKAAEMELHDPLIAKYSHCSSSPDGALEAC